MPRLLASSSSATRSLTPAARRVTVTANTSRPKRRITAALKTAAAELAATEIAFIDHPQFRKRGAEKWLAAQEPDMTPSERRRSQGTIGIAFVTGLVEAPLLTHPQERYLFLKMNFLKSQAEKWRRQINLAHPDPELIAKIQAALAESGDLRNRIVEANLRLVVAVAKKLSRSLDQLSELTSEGLLPLMRAVELFDVHLGNRFSTYATWAVRNQMHRALKRARDVTESAYGEQETPWDHLADHRSLASTELQAQEQRQTFLAGLMTELTDRERKIVAARFGLAGEPGGQSLSEISAQLGLSKERVRQIILQGVEKLRRAAEQSAVELPESWDPGT